MAKSYYEELGISRDANPEDIKKAYRKLARKYHPDVSKEADAEAKMQSINVAYDVLSNQEKKKQYDFELDHPQSFDQFRDGNHAILQLHLRCLLDACSQTDDIVIGTHQVRHFLYLRVLPQKLQAGIE